ncbi:MAG: ADP-forming succinate--CoA ligase subunit beta [Chloroflexi bacterium]|nr:ADP-forming succinate--CoA ligase subunit beta [Chloroflexota bacterium]
MKIHEYQAKGLLAQYRIPIPRGRAARSLQEAREIARELGTKVVLKAQVHAGGRGKGGGIRQADTPHEAEAIARALLGKRLVTSQTGPGGLPVNEVLVEEAAEIRRELYLGIALDRKAGLPVVLASPSGGMDIEQMARDIPERVFRAGIDLPLSARPSTGRKLAVALDLEPGLLGPFSDIVCRLLKLYWEKDCSLAEINPLALTARGKLLALDAKLIFDDNALFRHPELQQLRDPEQEDPREREALSLGLRNYVRLDGNIGCMVNGAGLAMAVMDLITLAGGRPANFLDIGTLNTPERVVNAFKVLVADPGVRAVLVNIFGGMARVDVIARGMVEAFKSLDIRFPVVVRLAGTNAEEGQRILEESRLPLIFAGDMGDAARKAVEAAR